MDWPQLTSGFIGSLFGALVGFFAALYTQRWQARRDTRNKLRTILLNMKEFEFAQVVPDNAPQTDYRQIYRNSFAEVNALYISYTELFFCTCRLKNAWREYKGVDKKQEKRMPTTCQPPSNYEQLSNRIDAFLNAL